MRCGCSALSHITHFRRVCAHACIQTPMLPKSTQKRHELSSAFLSSSLISPQSGGWSGPQDSMVSTRATRATRKSGSNNRQVYEVHQLLGSCHPSTRTAASLPPAWRRTQWDPCCNSPPTGTYYLCLSPILSHCTNGE